MRPAQPVTADVGGGSIMLHYGRSAVLLGSAIIQNAVRGRNRTVDAQKYELYSFSICSQGQYLLVAEQRIMQDSVFQIMQRR